MRLIEAGVVMIRVGIGNDAHRFAAGRKLVLGGVEIPADEGLLGHSDADVLTHAIMDALLGAVAAGDIGGMFPDTDTRWKDADSLELLQAVVSRLAGEGWRIGNVDATVIAEVPKLAPYIGSMREAVAAALGVETDAVSIKATTVEGMGAIGRREGIAATAVALVLKQDDLK